MTSVCFDWLAAAGGDGGDGGGGDGADLNSNARVPSGGDDAAAAPVGADVDEDFLSASQKEDLDVKRAMEESVITVQVRSWVRLWC